MEDGGNKLKCASSRTGAHSEALALKLAGHVGSVAGTQVFDGLRADGNEGVKDGSAKGLTGKNSRVVLQELLVVHLGAAPQLFNSYKFD